VPLKAVNMASTPTQPDQPSAAKAVAAIDIGSNALRMVIAEVYDDGRIEPLERLQRAVRLGQDTFRRGRLGGQSMRAAVAVLKDFRQLLRLYSVERVRAVATSAVREAGNADTFLDRVFMVTGLHVEVIDTSEESRLAVSAVRPALDQILREDRQILIADVGGGSTLLTLLEGGEIVNSQSLRLGSIWLQEVLSTSEEAPKRSAELLRFHITNVISTAQGSLPLEDVETFVALGGDARFVARQVGRPVEADAADLTVVETADLDRLVERCQKHAAEELVRRFGLSFADAETLNPALLVYQILLRRTRADRMIVSHVSMRDGLLLELAREVTGQEDQAMLGGVIHSATALAEKYHADPAHARNVAEISMRLFDELQADHGLGPRQRLLLRVAALLHEVGGFVSLRSHHKHSYYLLVNAEIFGLNREEIRIVALVARYHRRSPPKPSHLEYMALPRETRVLVNKLAAILRVADALARGHARNAADVRLERQGDELVVCVPGGGDLLLEQRAVAAKGDMFEDIYGMKVRLETG
jgi:exopolyphosphatase / guanosine-5'-triphosphate,3'-diphosphate pyrophosphatase